jgi:hypothetical protein
VQYRNILDTLLIVRSHLTVTLSSTSTATAVDTNPDSRAKRKGHTMKSKISKKLWTGVAVATLAGVAGIGGAQAASAADDPAIPASPTEQARPNGRSDRAAKVCERLDDIEATMAHHLDQIATRQTWLTTKREQAVAAGRDKLVERIDRASARLTERTTKVHDRIDRLETWAAEHCPAT